MPKQNSSSMNLLTFLLARFVRRGAQGLTVVNLLPGACWAFISLRGEGVAVLGWLCLPSALAGATSNCYRGEKTCSTSSFGGCLWRVGKERAVCAWSSVVAVCFVELGRSKHGNVWVGSRLPAKGRRKVGWGKSVRSSDTQFLITVLALRADEHIPQFSIPFWITFFLCRASFDCRM